MDTLTLLSFLSCSVPLSLGIVWVHQRSRQKPQLVLHYGLCPSHPSWRSFFTYFLIHQRFNHLISNLVVFWILGFLAVYLSEFSLWFIATGCGFMGGGLLDMIFRSEEREQPLIGMSAGNIAAGVALASQVGKGIISYQGWLTSFVVGAAFSIVLIRIEKRKLPMNFYPHLGGILVGILIGFFSLI